MQRLVEPDTRLSVPLDQPLPYHAVIGMQNLTTTMKAPSVGPETYNLVGQGMNYGQMGQPLNNMSYLSPGQNINNMPFTANNMPTFTLPDSS